MKTPLRVLFVEDSDDDTQLLLRALAKGGYEVEHLRVDTAPALSQALDEAVWDAVIVDYQIPGFGGIAAIEIIRESGLDLPVIMVSGKIGEETAVEAMKAGAHDCVMKDKLARLAPAIKRELAEAENRRQRRVAVERVQQLNLVLRAIRNVNQLIVTEKNRDKLLKGVCDSLIETRGYHSAWIVLMREGKLVAHAMAGVRGGLSKVLKRLELKQPVNCIEQALLSKDVVSTPDVRADCGDCPMVQGHAGLGAMSCRLEHAGRVYGVLTVSVDPERAVHAEEVSLFHEVSHDVGLALHAIDQEEQRRKAVRELRESEARYRQVFEKNPIGIYRTTPDGRVLMANPALIAMLGFKSFEELTQRNLVDQEYYPDYPREQFKSALERDGQIEGLESAWRRADGSTVYVRENARVVRNAAGEVSYYEGTAENITERKHAEEATEATARFPSENPSPVMRFSEDGELLYANRSSAFLLQQWGCGLNAQVAPQHVRDRISEVISSGGSVELLEDFSGVFYSALIVSIAGRNYVNIYGRDITARKQAEDALRASEERFRTVVESSTDALIAIGHDGLIEVFNPAAERMFGIQAADALNQQPAILVPDKLRAEHAKSIASYLTSGKPGNAMGKTVELQARRADGSSFPVELSLSQGQSGDEELVLAIVRDISARKQAEEALRISEKGLKEAQALGRIGSWAFDVESQQISWSDQAYRLYERDPTLGPPTTEEEAAYYSLEQSTILREYARRAIEEGEDFEYDLEARLPGGRQTCFTARMHPVKEAHGRVTKLLGTIQDITERKQAEEELRESERRLLEAQRTAIIGDWNWNLETNTLYWSVEHYRIFGLDPQRVSPSFEAFIESIVPQEREYVKRSVQETFSSEAPTDIDFSIVRPDGAARMVNVKAKAILDKTGKATRISGTVQDITERKLAEQERETMLQRQEGISLLQQQLLAPAPLVEKLKSITDSIVQLFDADFCRVWLIHPGDRCAQDCIHATVLEGPHVCRDRERCLHLMASSGRYTHTDGAVHRRVPFGCYKIGLVASGEDHKFITNDVQDDPRVHDHEWARELGLVSFAGYQLRSPGGQILGVLALFAKHPISPAEDVMLDGLSSTVARVILQARAEEALRQSNRLIQLVVDTTPVRVFWKDKELRYLGCNINFAEDAGLSAPAEIIGKTDNELIWRADADAYRADDQQVLDCGQAKTGFEERMLLDDGTVKWLRTSKVPLRNAEGEIIGVLGCYDDITLTREAQDKLEHSHQQLLTAHEQLKLQQKQLVQSEKLASLGQLAAGVAHEINNPIAYIKSNLGTLKDYLRVFKELIETSLQLAAYAESGDHDGVARARARLAQVEQEEDPAYILKDVDGLIAESISGTERVRDIVQDLRLYAHSGQEESVEADINQIIESSLRIAWTELKYKCEVIQDLRPLPKLRCYPDRLHQVFVNILVNSAQAIDEHGKVEISTQATDHGIIVRIADTGQGISPEVISKIFDPFFTTKMAGKGTGLGLAISYTTIQNHGGTIEVSSELGKGTEFVVSLPFGGVSA